MTRDGLWHDLADRYTLRAIVACDEKGGMSINGRIPWRIQTDFEYFWHTVRGSKVLGGKRTINEVRRLWHENNCTAFDTSIDSMLELLTLEPSAGQTGLSFDASNPADEDVVWVVGGAQVIKAALPHLERIHVTMVGGDWACDTKIDLTAICERFPNIRPCKVSVNETYVMVSE